MHKNSQKKTFIYCQILTTNKFMYHEATSALDKKNETQMYNLLKDMSCTYISIAHNYALIDFHERVILFVYFVLQYIFEHISGYPPN